MDDFTGWGNRNVVYAIPSSLTGINIPESAKDFLMKHGMPAEFGIMQFNEVKGGIQILETYPQFKSSEIDVTNTGRYYVIGKDTYSFSFTCIESESGAVYNMINMQSKSFANTCLFAYAECVSFYMREYMESDPDSMSPRTMKKVYRDFRQHIQRVDPDCLRREDCIWIEDLYRLEHGFF